MKGLKKHIDSKNYQGTGEPEALYAKMEKKLKEAQYEKEISLKTQETIGQSVQPIYTNP